MHKQININSMYYNSSHFLPTHMLPSRTRFRLAYKTMSEQMAPDTFITLATNNTWSVAQMKKLVGHFFGRMDRWYLGHTWHKEPIEKRTDGIGFIEHTETNIHAHIIARFDKGNFWGREIMAKRYWNTICEAGSINVQPVYDVGRLAEYVTKEMELAFYKDDEQIIFLRDYFPQA